MFINRYRDRPVFKSQTHRRTTKPYIPMHFPLDRLASEAGNASENHKTVNPDAFPA